MRMKPLTQIAAGTALGLSLFAGAVFADAHSMAVDDELAAKVQEAVATLPPDNEGTAFSQIDVMAEDGMLVLSGLVESNTALDSINQMLQDMDGLDMDKVQNDIVVQ